MTTAIKDRGGWISTFTGQKFYPCDPQPEDINIQDIAHALSNTCRFTGHVRRFYSVAEHCVRVVGYIRGQYAGGNAPARVLLTALLHDASEAYLCDVARPVKRSAIMAGYREIEGNLEAVIAKKFSLIHPMPGVVKEADDVLLVTEARDLVPSFGPEWQHWALKDKAIPAKIVPIRPSMAKLIFLDEYKRIMSRIEREAA